MAGIAVTARWISGKDYDYGANDAGYYDGHLTGLGHPNHVLSRTFWLTTNDLAKAVELSVASLGYRVVTLNGARVGNEEISGGWTNPTKLVYVDTYDVSPLVHEGQNTLQIELGNGWYNPSPLTMFAKYNLRERLAEVGTPRAIATLWCGDKPLLVTDAVWRVQDGPVLFNNVYLGETHNLAWRPGEDAPASEHKGTYHMEPTVMQPCRRFKPIEASHVEPYEDGLLIDFGCCVTGMVRFTFMARAGHEVTFSYAESLRDGEPLFLSSCAGLVGLPVPSDLVPSGKLPGGPGAPNEAWQLDRALCSEGENRFESKFSYHSFRYVYVAGLAERDLRRAAAIPVHADLPLAGQISTGNAHYERLLDIAMRTKLNNVHASFEDCARERLGYGGDMVALAASNLYAFDAEGIYRKTVRDFRNDQTSAGGVPETVPYMGIQSNGTGEGEGPLLWQLAYPFLIEQCERFYGATDLVREEWPYVRKLVDYLLTWDPVELATRCLGDHGSVATTDFKAGTPDKDFVGWCAIAWIVRCGVRLAGVMGDEDACQRYDEALDTLLNEIRSRFAHDDGSFGEGTQTSYSFAAEMGLADRQALGDGLAARFDADGGILTCGIFGTTLAYTLLHDTGHDDVVERWLCRAEAPSFEAMLALGNGTLTEQFVMEHDSYNHAMFSSYVQWFYDALLGIRVDTHAVAADCVTMRPYFSPLTDHVKGGLDTRQGRIEVEWWRDGDGVVHLRSSVPVGVCVTYDLPDGAMVE